MKTMYCFLIGISMLLAVPWGAFADAQAIDFGCIWEYWTYRFEDLLLSDMPDIHLVDSTEEGGVGVADLEEFGMLSLILADPAAPRHEEVHAAFTVNAALARAAIGPWITGLTTSIYDSGPMARQPIPGTDPQRYYGLDGIMAAYITMGEWNVYVGYLAGYENTQWGIEVPSSSEGYQFVQELGMYGDIDGDGVPNANEYWASNPRSFANALDPGVVESAVTWDVWACMDEPGLNARFWCDAVTERLYTMSVSQITWAEAVYFEFAYPDGTPILISLCNIGDQNENDFVASVANRYEVWIGCTDAGRDIGHAAPNPDDWYWLNDPGRNPMTFTNWHDGFPKGVDGVADCAVLNVRGCWQDVSEFVGAPPEPRRRLAVFELAGTYPDDDGNGAPDAFEDKDGDLLPDGFESEGEGEGEEGEGENEGLPPGCLGRC